MTQQDDITQRVLTDDEIMRSAISACDSLNITRVHEIGAPSKTIMDDAGLLELGRAIETALLSKLRAPMADERALQAWADRFPEISDMGRLRDAWNDARASPAPGWGCAHKNKVANVAAYVWLCRDCNKFIPREPGDSALASAPVAGEQPIKLSDDVLHFLKEGVENATQCEEADVDHEFADQLLLLMHTPLYTGPRPKQRKVDWGPLVVAPVAGEQIIAWDVQDTGLGRRYTTYNPKVAEDLMNLGENVRPLVYASALPPANPAPQASAEDVRNAALEALEAARQFIGNGIELGYIRMPDAATPDPAHRTPGLIDAAIHALKTQADKDGGQQRAGDVDERAVLDGVRAALADLLDYVDSNTCIHESTHRGGAIWTICDGCGAKWADDEGGFVPHQDAPAVAAARAALSAPRPNKESGMPDHIPYPTSCEDAQGRVWHAYSVKFYSPDGSYECHISAISDDHARLQLDALKETGHLTGQTLEIHDE